MFFLFLWKPNKHYWVRFMLPLSLLDCITGGCATKICHKWHLKWATAMSNPQKIHIIMCSETLSSGANTTMSGHWIYSEIMMNLGCNLGNKWHLKSKGDIIDRKIWLLNMFSKILLCFCWFFLLAICPKSDSAQLGGHICCLCIMFSFLLSRKDVKPMTKNTIKYLSGVSVSVNDHSVWKLLKCLIIFHASHEHCHTAELSEIKNCSCMRVNVQTVGTCGDWRLISIIIDLDACRQAGGVRACVGVCARAWVLSRKHNWRVLVDFSLLCHLKTYLNDRV